MKRMILLIVAVCSIATMLYFSSRTAEISSQQSQAILDILLNLGFETNSYFIRKLAHFIIFIIIGFCVSMFIGCYLTNPTTTSITSIVISSCYACIDEYLQTYIPGRYGSVNDVILDISGVIIGIILYNIINHFMYNN